MNFEVTDKGNLTDNEQRVLEHSLYQMFENAEFKDVTLSAVVSSVKATINETGDEICENFPGKSFTVTIYIYDEDEKVQKTIEVKCKDGKLA